MSVGNSSLFTSPDGPVQPAEIFADVLPASGAEVIRTASLLCRWTVPLGPAAKQVLLPAGTLKTIIKTAGEAGEGCSGRLLFAFSREVPYLPSLPCAVPCTRVLLLADGVEWRPGRYGLHSVLT